MTRDIAAAVVPDAWSVLRRRTPARIALGRSGISQPSAPQLAFQLAHAQARDAVHLALDGPRLAESLGALGLAPIGLHSAAADRHIYLQRPDLGRRLDDASREALQSLRAKRPAGSRFDLALVIADGLSALAIQRHAPPFIAALQPRLAEDWRLAPLSVVQQARVAVGDEIGELLDANLAVVLIGERPGLSSPDSMGLYITWSPCPGRTDAQRNCISNVRPEGLGYADAAAKLAYLLAEARRRRLTGIGLKDESGPQAAALGANAGFLLAPPGDAEPA